MALARLDHVIFRVPDIDSAHRELTASLPEAWSAGHFWPGGRTSGIALGGLNLELMQFDDGSVREPIGTTLVFEPDRSEDLAKAFAHAGVTVTTFDKMESDPELLRLRGFSEEASLMPQLICQNLLPENRQALPVDFIVCDYSPFLRDWLSPSHPRLDTSQKVTAIVYGTPAPEAAGRMLNELGYTGQVDIEFVRHEDRRILRIDTAAGPLRWPS